MKTSAVARVATQVVGGLEHLSPQLAAAFAARMFFRAPARRPVFEEEQQSLDAAVTSTVRYDGDTLVVHRWGAVPADLEPVKRGLVLLIHGWGGNAAQMTPFVRPLLSAGYEVVAMDAPGHGESEGSEVSAANFASAIKAVVEAHGPITAVIAHSFGALATSVAIARGLPVDAAIFVAPPSGPRPWFELFVQVLDLSSRVEAIARQKIEAHAGIAFDDLEARQLGPRVVTPLLVMHDLDDKEVPSSAAETVRDNAKEATLVLTNGLGHKRILKDGGVHTRAIAFITQTRRRVADARCSGCGQSSPHGLCARCELGADLFDRRQRWLANAHAT